MQEAFTRYDADTGNIICVMKCSEEQAALNGPYIKGEHNAEKYRIVDGQPVLIGQEEIEQKAISKAWIELRNTRSGLLSESDWTQVPDAPVDQQAWAAYRQALRDLPANTEDPRNPQWPTPPA